MFLIEYQSIQVLRFALSSLEEGVSIVQDPKYIRWNEVFSFLNKHLVAQLASCCVDLIPEEFNDTKVKWKESVYLNIYNYTRILKHENIILNAFKKSRIPIVVVKGTSAAKYYHQPQLRTLGDIDLLVRPEDYDRAVSCLLGVGCNEIKNLNELVKGRHRSFQYGDVDIELHHRFASQIYGDTAKALDNMLFKVITDEVSVLPDDENGLVLLSHVRQHLKSGIGLRHLIDWMMFVKCHLDDNKWFSSFQKKARITELEVLAVVLTKICQKYLGLTTERITWCDGADDKICDDLMKYFLECGNFGRNQEVLRISLGEKLPRLSHPIQLFKYVQMHGEINWIALKKHPWLKPFAWIYQSFRYMKLAVHNRVGVKRFKDISNEILERNIMFTTLGLK